MKRLMLLAAALGAGLALSGCEEPARESEMAPPPMEAPVAPAATDQGAPAAETGAATDQPPADASLPPEQRTSEETVQPESETLFY